MSISPVIRCPLCHSTVAERENGLTCDQGHQFDRARQGYYHLLPAHRKRSRDPGDSPMMVQARRAFLDQGHYAPVSEAVAKLLGETLAACDPPKTALTLLDCGCGEGYYTANLRQQLQCQGYTTAAIGVDISKSAVRQACQRDREIDWLVASGSQLPVVDRGLDLLLCLFSRLMPAEFQRVLAPQGYLLLATTGAEHLIELRELLYKDVKRQHFDPDPRLQGHFTPVRRETLSFPFQLEGREAIQNLLAMTPHQWRSRADAQQALLQREQLSLTADIQLHLYQPCDDQPDHEQACEQPAGHLGPCS